MARINSTSSTASPSIWREEGTREEERKKKVGKAGHQKHTPKPSQVVVVDVGGVVTNATMGENGIEIKKINKLNRKEKGRQENRVNMMGERGEEL